MYRGTPIESWNSSYISTYLKKNVARTAWEVYATIEASVGHGRGETLRGKEER